MGAEFAMEELEFVGRGISDNELLHAFQELCEQAAWDFGHAGYTGTLAEKSNAVINRDPFENYDAAYKHLIMNNDKWWPADIVCFHEGGKLRWAVAGVCSS